MAALVVLHESAWTRPAESLGIDPRRPDVLGDSRVEPALLERIAALLKTFPGYAQVRRVLVCRQAWDVEGGLLTATMKLRRAQVAERYRQEIEDLYAGH